MRLLTVQTDMARRFASEYGIDIDTDIRQVGESTPVLARLERRGRSIVHITDSFGADYYIARIDYYKNTHKAHASRVIAVVMPGYRTKLAYWSNTASKKEFTVHRGIGYLIIGNPEVNDIDNGLGTTMFPLDPDVTARITLPPGRFYTLEAVSWSTEPLIISGLCESSKDGNWENTEVVVEPGQETILAPEGIVVVPEEFMTARFD